MTLSLNQSGLLEQAISAFNQETGLILIRHEANGAFPDADACLELHPYGIKYWVELKRWTQHANVGSLMAQLSKMPAPALLVADYVNPNMADRMREAGIQFVDTAGNAYIEEQGLYIFVKGNRSASGMSVRRKTTRAFNASGLKVIFSFLLEPTLAGETYRTIAAAANVSLGTIGWVLNDLKEKGYIQELGKSRSRVLRSPLELLDRWVEAYPEKLLPEVDLGLFRTSFQVPWKEIDPTEFGGCWGGEVGAFLLDGYLSPAQGLAYLPRTRLKEFVIENRLRKSRDSENKSADTIRVCEAFWNSPSRTFDRKPGNVAPDILIYGDLVASGEPRNLEAAEKLYGRIRNRLRIN